MLVQVDPVAKACVPIYVQVFVESDDYGPTFKNNMLIFYNALSRIDLIWLNSYQINYLFTSYFNHDYTDEEIATIVSSLITQSKQLGDLVGLNFKYFYYSLNLEDGEQLYAYPD